MGPDLPVVPGAQRNLGAEELFRRLATSIADGTYAPGAKLSDKAIADDLGVTRTPVREAVQRLARAGLMEVHANCLLYTSDAADE